METFAEAILKKRERKAYRKAYREAYREAYRDAYREGCREGKREIIEKMRGKGWSFEQIADLMDTTVEEIRGISCCVPAGV